MSLTDTRYYGREQITELRELQQYLLDLKGYLVIEDALSPSDVDTINEHIDAQYLPPPTTYNRFGSAPMGSGLLGWHTDFCNLIDHESVVAPLRFLLGPDFALRTVYGIYEERFIGQPMPSALSSDSNPGSAEPLTCGVLWNVTSAGPGIGGFCCVEGSHRMPNELPRAIQYDPRRSTYVVTPDAPAGSVIVFTSRLKRGDARWYGPHQRRSLVFEYTTAGSIDKDARIAVPASGVTEAQTAALGYFED